MVVCRVITPVVVTVIARAGLPVMPYLMALALSANLGSVATLADRSARRCRTLRR